MDDAQLEAMIFECSETIARKYLKVLNSKANEFNNPNEFMEFYFHVFKTFQKFLMFHTSKVCKELKWNVNLEAIYDLIQRDVLQYIRSQANEQSA